MTKHWALVAALPLVLCATGSASPTNDLGDKQDEEVETQIAVLESPVGDGPYQRERERAADWLIAHATYSYPRMLAHLDAGRASPALIEILPRFGRAESIGRLERLMAGPELNAWSAGQALAKHPQRAAGEALRRALGGPSIPVAIIAADALGTRADHADCPALVAASRAHAARLRYHAVQAGAKLGCFSPAALQSLARSDADAEVRSLAAGLNSQARPSPALLEQAATSDEALRSLLDAATGLVLIEYYDGGGVRQARHLCDEELERALPAVRAGLLRDRKDWRTATALRCWPDQCTYNPGEPAGYYARYFFRHRPGGSLALSAIVRLESGALDTTKQERFAARAMHNWRNAGCPR